MAPIIAEQKQPSTPGDLVSPDGTVWRVTEHTRGGAALYVIDGVEVAACPRLVMSTRAELQDIFGTDLRPVGGAA
ncbi:hypothetical protein ACWD5R_08025 [Streptomyces sp. NPDC002514]|uniref:hypothetical protein n=1 Tax=Streptomyces sp. NPDC001270 TaxID=3364554 RepID=UPI0036BD28EC